MAAAIFKAMSKMEAIVSSFALQNTPTLQFTMGQPRRTKQTASSHIRSIEAWGVSCFQRVARTAAQRCMEGEGEGKIYFPPFKRQSP